MEFEQVRQLGERIKNNMGKAIVGKELTIELVVICLFCSGHVLLEDVPGVGKTVLAKSLAKSVDCSFKRIQFTPDLLPSDVTGINYYNPKFTEFIFRPGPVFTNILLADEINRATPRTQSSLLECMEEGQVTIDGETRTLTEPFFVMATQNPLETQGTFPLPEAQLDRFFMRLTMGYPSTDEGRQILDRFQEKSRVPELGNITNGSELVEAQRTVQGVKVGRAVKDYILQIVELTREHEKVALGASPRGSLALMKAAQVHGVFRGRNFVTPDDVKAVAVPVLAHRIIPKGYRATDMLSYTKSIIYEILHRATVPMEDFHGR